MRKLLFCLFAVFVSLTGPGVFTPQAIAAARIECQPNSTREQQVTTRKICESACAEVKNRTEKLGCFKVCDETFNTCTKQREAREHVLFEKELKCREPVIACVKACKSDEACKKKCGEGSKQRFDACVKR
jgi:hypothetical protein